jgi:lantibiotic modifying enzyme
VVRDTLSYGLLLSQSLEPGNLRSGHCRRSILRSALQGTASANFPAALLRTELHALLHLHVPRLIALPGTRTLASGSGHSLVSCFADCTPAEAVIRRIEELSAERLEAVHVPALLLAVLHTGDSF